MRIVRASKERMAEVARVFKASRRACLPYLPKLHTELEDSKYFSEHVFAKDQVHVAEDDHGRVSGFIAFDEKWIDHLYLLPEERGHGIGERLLAVAKGAAASLCLWTFQRNAAAIRFYQKQGFRIVKRTDGADNEEKEPDVLMEWKG